MAQVESIKFTTPVGRAVSGHPTEGRTQDAEGKPLVIKNGANAGQPRTEYYTGLAIKKNAGVDWKQESWGQQIMACVRRDFPSMIDNATQDVYQGRQFAFKVADGDSQVPNTKGNRPCDNEGWQGNWIIHCSTSIAPGAYRFDRSKNQPVPLDHPVKLGDFFQFAIEVRGNGSTQQSGVYLNTSMLCFAGYGAEIIKVASANPMDAGFGDFNAGAIEGMSEAPIGGMETTAPSVPAPQVAPSVPTPAHDLVAPQVPIAPQVPVAPQLPELFEYQGTSLTMEKWNAAGWTAEMVHQHCTKKAA